MDPNSITLETIDKQFEYEKYSRILDELSDIEEIKKFSKYSLKLYLKQQEVVRDLISNK